MSLVHTNKNIWSVLANSKNVLEIRKTEWLIFWGAGGYKPTADTLAYYTASDNWVFKDIVGNRSVSYWGWANFDANSKSVSIPRGWYMHFINGTPTNWGTVSFWIRIDWDFNFILFSSDYDGNWYMFQVQDSWVSFDNLQWFNWTIGLSQRLQKNRWYNLVLTQDWSTTKLYIDWVYRGAVSANIIYYSFHNFWQYYAYRSYQFDWLASDIIFERYAWGDQKVRDVYNSQKPVYVKKMGGGYTW